MKKIFCLIMIVVLSLTLSLVGCEQTNDKTDDSSYSSSSVGDNSSSDSGNSSSGGGSGGEAGEWLTPKILVVSDVHVSADTTTKEHLKNTLLYALDEQVDAIIFNGDIADLGNDESYSHLDDVFTKTYGNIDKADRPELIFNMGNHEFYPSGNCAHEETVYDVQIGKFKAFAEKWGEAIEDNVFVRNIKGIKCIIAFPSDENSFVTGSDIILKATGQKLKSAGEKVYLAATGGYSQNDVDKVKSKFDEIIGSDYDKTVVFCTHHPLGETYGSTLYGMLSESEAMFKAMLKDYPQVVHIAGHTHFSSLHERSIAQKDWTSIQIGMHTYGKYVSGVDTDEDGNTLNYLNITGKRYNTSDATAQAYHGKTHFGVLLTFTEEKMTAERIYLSTGEKYEHGIWEVPYGITKENKHKKFYYEDGERTGETLTFGEDTQLKAKVVNGELTEISFKDVDQYWACEGYEIVIGDDQGIFIKKILWSSHFWMGLKEKQTYTIALSDIPLKDGYTIRLRAINFFGKYSEPCGDTVSVEQTDETHPHKTLISAGTSYQKDADELKDYSSVTFYYKIESGEKLVLAIVGENWSTNYYGYLTFTASGPEGKYDGVTCVGQADGYYFVTLNLHELTRISGNAPDAVQSFYVRGAYTTANVYIDEVSFND